MKAVVVIIGPGEVKLTELEQPTIGPDDVLIRSRAVGICGGDVELYRGIRLEGIAGEGIRLNVESDIFVLKHLTVMGIFGASSAAWTHAVQMFRAGLLNLAPLITHRFALADYRAALETLMHRQPKTLKVMIVHARDQEGREQ